MSVHDRHLFAVVDGARAAALRMVPAAGRDVDVDDYADRAEAAASQRYRERFGCDGEDGHVVVLGGTVAAHVIHAQAVAADYFWSGHVTTAGLLGAHRTQAAADIRRLLASASGPGDTSPETNAGRVLATWLAQTGGTLMVGAAGKVARHVCGHVKTQYGNDHLAAGWWAVVGPHLVRVIAAGIAPVGEEGGRPTGDDGPRALLRWAVASVDATGAVTRSALAEKAGVSRVTLYAWLDKD